jgi:hypothetical protein
VYEVQKQRSSERTEPQGCRGPPEFLVTAAPDTMRHRQQSDRDHATDPIDHRDRDDRPDSSPRPEH